jgi:hypothetical protein
MPKRNIVMIQLPAEKPDMCAACPLVGIVPAYLKPKGSQEKYVCMGTNEAITAKGIYVKASVREKKKHPLHRPCDNRWHAWMELPYRRLGISNTAYIQCRIPYEQAQQLKIKFHCKASKMKDHEED